MLPFSCFLSIPGTLLLLGFVRHLDFIGGMLVPPVSVASLEAYVPVWAWYARALSSDFTFFG